MTVPAELTTTAATTVPSSNVSNSGADAALQAAPGHGARAGTDGSFSDQCHGVPSTRCASAERSVRPVAEAAAATQVVDHCSGHDRHDARTIAGADGEPDPARLEFAHHARRCCQAVGTATREAHHVHPLYEVLGAEEIGLVGTRTSAAHVDAAHRTVAIGDHDRGARPPPGAASRRVADAGSPRSRR